ncbi:hypothetical protein LEMLEM_LOCUS9540 [Lemmus lemmus]
MCPHTSQGLAPASRSGQRQRCRLLALPRAYLITSSKLSHRSIYFSYCLSTASLNPIPCPIKSIVD